MVGPAQHVACLLLAARFSMHFQLTDGHPRSESGGGRPSPPRLVSFSPLLSLEDQSGELLRALCVKPHTSYPLYDLPPRIEPPGCDDIFPRFSTRPTLNCGNRGRARSVV